MMNIINAKEARAAAEARRVVDHENHINLLSEMVKNAALNGHLSVSTPVKKPESWAQVSEDAYATICATVFAHHGYSVRVVKSADNVFCLLIVW